VRAGIGGVLAAAAILAGCQGSGGEGGAGAPAAAPAAAAPGTAVSSPGPAPTIAERTLAVAKTVWYGGFKLTVREARLRPGALELVTAFENLGTETRALRADVVVQSAGRNYFETAASHDVPTIPGGASQDGTLAVAVDGLFRLDDAVVVIGRADTNQARFPLGDRGPVIAFRPAPVPVAGSVSAGQLRVVVRSAELRGDILNQYRQAGRGRLALRIDYTAEVSNCQTVEFGLSLVLPDGTPVDPIGGDTADGSGRFRVFEVPDPPKGHYQLRLEVGAGTSVGSGCPRNITGSMPFDLP
jgi:hypothetical protein